MKTGCLSQWFSDLFSIFSVPVEADVKIRDLQDSARRFGTATRIKLSWLSLPHLAPADLFAYSARSKPKLPRDFSDTALRLGTATHTGWLHLLHLAPRGLI